MSLEAKHSPNRVPGPAAPRAKVPRSVGSASANPAAARAFHPRLDDEPGRTRSRASGRQGAWEEAALALQRLWFEDERYCIDVVTQINAVRAALDKIALGLVDDHVRHCLRD